MKNNTIDLNRLKSEIESEKMNKNKESFGKASIAPKDAFLYSLNESLRSGRKNVTADKILSISKQADISAGLKSGRIDTNQASNKLNEIKEQRVATRQPINNSVDSNRRSEEINMSPERDEELFKLFENGNKKTLGESLFDYNKVNKQQQIQQSSSINEGNIKKIFDDYITNNLASILNEAINNTIIEMYAIERIEKVLHENKELIKSVVIETIKEIQAKNKAKQQ
jgi:hypothetical protein